MNRARFPIALAALILIQGLFVYGYVAHEHTIYFWDHSMYHNMARLLAAAFHEGWAPGFSVFRQSLAQDYNYFFALPSLLAFSVFGSTRAVFLLTNFLVFFIAFEVATAFVLRRVFAVSWPTGLLLGFGACSLVPPLWLPLLEGYPDVGAAACVALAVGLHVRGPGKWRTALIAGLLLGLAVLLRRHFVYAGVAFFAVLFAIGLYDSLSAPTPRRCFQKALRVVVYCGLSGLILTALIGLVSPSFLLKAITIDYGALYLSYKRPPGFFLVFALSGFGGLLVAAALSGFVLAARKRPVSRRPLAFIVILTLVWLVVWCMGPSQAGHHYLLHVLPLFAAIGLAGLFLVFGNRSLMAGLVAVVLSANSAWALWLAPDGVRPNDHGAPRLWSAPRPPVVRQDYDELSRLASHLAATTTNDDRLFVLGSSFVFNQDLLRAVYTDVLRQPAPLSRFLQGPEIDSNQSSPLNPFASATVYVVPEPPQYHLDPALQKVITATASQFPPPSSRDAFFQRDEQAFHLEGGMVAHVWRRKPWTPGVLHAALSDVRKNGFVSLQAWVALSGPSQLFIGPENNGRTDVAAVFDTSRSNFDLFRDLPLSAGRYRLTVAVARHQGCRAPEFDFAVVTEQGSTAAEGRFVPTEAPGPVYWIFSAPSGPSFLHLRFGAAPSPICSVLLHDIRVEPLERLP
jgi:hypothetical protein